MHRDFEVAKRTAEASSIFARIPGVDLGRFPLTGKGDVNTFALFAELFSSCNSKRGRSGIIAPTGIVSDANTAEYFSSLVRAERLVSVYSFENEALFFPNVHHAFKFCLLVSGNKEASSPTDYSIFLRYVDDLQDDRRHFEFSSEQITKVNPNTQTAPLFRSAADAELTLKLYTRVPILLVESTALGNPWGLKFGTMFHMSSDSKLFSTRQELRDSGYLQNGVTWDSDLRSKGENQSLLPLYEGKLIERFDHRFATFAGLTVRPPKGSSPPTPTLDEKQDVNFEITPWYWVSKVEITSRLRAWNWDHQWLMGFRDVTNSTNERTVIASVTPGFGVNHKFPLMFTTSRTPQACALLANLNCLVLDYVARQKIGGMSLTYFYLYQLPVLPPSAYIPACLDFITSRVLELTYTSNSMESFARDLGCNREPFTWDEGRRALLRAELDAWYARAYGLTRDELRYILDPAEVMGVDYPSETFRVLKEKELKLYKEYRTRRLVLDAWDRMERGELSCPQPYLVPPQSAARSMTIVQRNISDQNPLLGAGPLFEGIESTPVEHPRFADPSTLPNDVWAMPNYNSISVQLQLAAILKQLSGPTSAARVRLAALYALHPDYLTPRLSGTELKTWQRLTGDRARISGADNVIQFRPRVNTEWRDAYTQLRGMRALVEDATNDTWAPGSVVQDFMTEGWADGRAGFVMKAMEGMEIETSIAELPVDLQTWVRAHAA